MASQVAHIVYGREYLEKHPSTMNRDEFILGCVFPDIRRIDEAISRRETHMKFDAVDLDFSGLTAFQAGWKFHLYCDMKREEILNNYDFYDLDGAGDFANVANKLLEDELLYDRYNNWEKLFHYFNHLPAVDSGLEIRREVLEVWYAILAKYVEKKPDGKSMHIFLTKQPSLAEKADGIIQSVENLRKNKKAVKILERVVEEIV